MDGKRVKFVSTINCLPEEVLAKILCFLPTKRAASTSLISKTWRNLFPLMIKLFESQHHIYLDDSDLVYPGKDGKRERKDVEESFRDFVNKTLSGCNSIKKLTLKCPRNCNAHTNTTDQWLRLALERGIEDLDVRFKMGFSCHQSRWPCCAFINIKTLFKLTLRIELVKCRLLFFKRACLPVLKSFSLHTLSSICHSLLAAILPGCPILEELSLHCLRGAVPVGGNEHFYITHKTLKRLTFDFSNSLPRFRVMLFFTPSLVYLDYSGCPLVHVSYPKCQLNSLVEAKLNICPSTSNYRSLGLYSIINCVRIVKTLSLSSASVKEMYSTNKELPNFFLNLVKLYFESDTKEGWQVMLRRLLNQSPKLETLVLKGLHGVGDQGISIDQNEVKVLEIYGFRGSRGELKLVKSFLWQMHFLQVMKLRIDAADDNMKRKLISDLLALRNRHSFKCQIMFL